MTTTDFWSTRVTAGDTFTGSLAEAVTRAHIARYAGASGDFNLVHVDERFATTRAGRPSVIAHGMFTMGLTATYLTSLVGHGSLRRFGGRFLAPVNPGDGLSCTATVEDVVRDGSGRAVVIAFDTRNTHGASVFRGQAVAHGPGPYR